MPTWSVVVLLTYIPRNSSAIISNSELGLLGADFRFGDKMGDVLFGVVERDIMAEEIGETLVDDLFESL